MDPFSLDHIFSCSSRSRAIRFPRRYSTQAWSLRSLTRFVFPVPMDRLHGSFILPPQRTRGHPQDITAFSLPSSCQRTRSAFVVQLWWRYGDLNPRPMACKATALATELYPQGFAPRRLRTAVYTEKGGEFERERVASRAPKCHDCTLRKEVIQPHLPVRLPCYDFTPLTSFTLVTFFPCGLDQPLRVLLTRVV